MSATPLDLECPACGVRIAWVFNGPLDERYPQICIGCRAVLVVDPGDVGEDGSVTPAFLRYPTDTEETAMLANPHVLAAIARVAEYHRREGPPMSHPPDGDPT